MTDVSHQIPYQVQQLIENLLNKRDGVHMRANYRMRLDTVRSQIDAAIRSYDAEVAFKDKRKA